MLDTLYKPALKIKGEAKFCDLGLGFPVLTFGDDCGNDHNTFSLTIDGKDFGGCCHDQILKFWPKYAHLIKWHGCSTDGPMYYIENTIHHTSEISPHQDKWYFYLENKLIRIIDGNEKQKLVEKYGINAEFKEWLNSMAKKPNLEYARSSAIAPTATLAQLQDEDWLKDRLPALMEEFSAAMLVTFGDIL